MALNFPNSPVNGQTYLGDNGVIYTFDGVKWLGSGIEPGSGFLTIPNLSNVTENIIPDVDNTRDLGTPAKQWRHVYTAGGSIYLDNIKLTNNAGKLAVTKVINPGEEDEAEDPEDSEADSEIKAVNKLVNGEHEFVLTEQGALELDGELYNPGGGADTGNVVFDGNQMYVGGTGFLNLETDNGEAAIGTNGPDSLLVSINEGDKVWTFDANGHVTFPDGSTQVTAYTGETGDSNVWIQTFESVDGAPTDVPALALSVEYDSAGNVIALFTHYNNNDNSSYYSVGKYTTTGTKIWTARFADGVNTDGWGLAVDNDTDTIYVAGQTTTEGPGYSVSTLTKLDAADGSVLWSKTYDFGYESTSAVVDVASDGNPVMVGYAYNVTDRYVTTTKVSALDGSITWTRSLDGQNDEEAYGMAVGPDGEVVVIGYIENIEYEGPINTILTLSASPASDPDWTVNQSITVGGVSFDVSFTDGVPTFSNIIDLDGNHTVGDTISNIPGISIGSGSTMLTVTVGTTTQENLDDRMLVVKYDSVGAIQWQKAILFDAGFNCEGADADIDSAGNIYVTGSYQYSFDGGTTSALSILKLDGNGAKQWSRRVQGNCDTFGISVVVGADDKLYLSGMTGINAGPEYIWVAAKYDFNGLVEWQRLIDNTTGWSFTGGIFFSNGGGSNLAVKQDYVLLAGGFGDLINSGTPQATVVQVAASGDVFSVGDWDFKAASFSGVLNGTASDITVINAGKTDLDNSSNVTTGTVTLETDISGFLLGTLYTVAVGNDRLVNNGNELVLGTTGTVTLPAGGTISEGYVTSNPTIQLTPASPDVASQKLVIKGGGNYNASANGIGLNWYIIDPLVNDTVEIYVNSPDNADQTLYWWIYPEGASIASPESGTVILNNGGSGDFSFTVDSDDYEFTVRVSPEANNYDPASGVETQLFNSSAPTFDSPHHLHLTTGNLAETSIFLGTDNHNVRTTVDGGIQVTTESTAEILPNTITITGADVTAVNLVYTRDLTETTPTWTSPEVNLATDPYIVYSVVDGEWGIFSPEIDPVIPLYVNTGTLVAPLTQWSLNPPYGSVAPTGVYTYLTPDVQEWKFGVDGALTLPNNGIIRVAEGSSKIKALVATSHSDNRTSDWTSAEYTAESSQGKIVFVDPAPSFRQYLSQRLAQSVTTTITINTNISLTYDYVDAGMDQVTLYVIEVPATDPTTVTDIVINTVAENRMEISDHDNRMAFISGSGWNVDIESKWTGDINLRAGDDVLIKAGDKTRSDSTGGDIDITAGSGGNADFDDSGGNGGSVDIFGGTGGAAGTEYNAGGGGAVFIRSGFGGDANTTGSNLAGSGADLTLEAGDGGYNQGDVTLGRSGGDVYIYAGDSTNDTAGGDILIQAGTGGTTTGGGTVTLRTKTTDNADREIILDNQGKTTLPGAVITGTAAKTGSDITANNVLFEVTAVDEFGVVTEITVTNSPNPEWISGTSGSSLGDVNFTVSFDGSGNASVTVNSSGTGHSIGQTFELGPEAVGATIPAPIALDLTKSVNKLADGYYSLANGVEGQTMYLVRQTGSTDTDITVQVANARVNGSTYTDYPHYPFSNGSSQNVTMLIFTDGAWQSNNGTWD